MIETNEKDGVESVAIIGMAGRFPGARNLAEFWEKLRDSVECVSFFSDEELASEGIDPALLADSNYIKAKAVLDDIDLFDATFFGLSPREAETMDPQQRFFLECAWEALESAGYDSERYPEAIAVYGGVSLNSYLMLNLLSHPGLLDSVGIMQASIRNRTDHLATRVAYKLNLKGAAVTVQTACSTSLVAVHLACQSLLAYQSDIALAGGVSIGVPKKAGYMFQEGGIFSVDGHCRAFDEKATGTVVGNGVGVVVLKRLSDALVDGDLIHAVIKGSAINNDGSSKVGYTAPSVDGQSEVIAMAQSVAAIDPETISYIETHGTGTPLGDPVEIAALTQVFRASTSKKNFCAIGSVKSNIGHLDTAAGVAGLIKTVLALKHAAIPPSLHFELPNPQIDFANSPFYVNNSLSEWKRNGRPRRAGVSSFGIGGTNAHIVLEEAPVQEDSGPSRPSHLVLLSAKSSAALETATTNVSTYLRQHPDVRLADVAYTLQVGRRAFSHRRMVVCRDAEDAAQTLGTLDPLRVIAGLQEPRERPVVFMFPGQGAQYANMGRELYAVEETFRQQVDLCAEHLRPHLGFDLRDMLFSSAEQLAGCDEKLRQTSITQPALFVIEYALAQVLSHWGVQPQAMIGHSIGEYVAACLAGVFSLKDALGLVAARGRLMGELTGGSMLMVPLPEKDVRPLLGNHLSLAAVNAPSMCVVSGTSDAVDELATMLNAKDVVCHALHTSHAFHSWMMEPALEEFTALMHKVKLQPPSIPFISNLTGAWITDAEATDPTYWAQQLRQTVRLSEGIAELFKEPDSILLEVGPGRTLMTIARWHPEKAAGQIVLHSLPHPDERGADLSSLLHNLGRMWLAGVEVNWDRFYSGERRRRIPLPTYPFERQSYWIDPQKHQPSADANGQRSLRKKPNVTDWFYVPSWRRSVPLVFSNAAESVKPNCCWLMFIDECGLGARMAAGLAKTGCDVVTVRAGEAFSESTAAGFIINPQQRSDYTALLDKLRAQGKRPTTIVHMWNVTHESYAEAEIDSEENILERGFYSLLWLTQAIGEQSADDPLRMIVVTNNMQHVTGEERLHPEKATVLGLCKVVPQEYRHITCRSLDITIPATGNRQVEKLADLLLGELAAETSDSIVAYRHQQRWTQVFEPHRLEKPADKTARLRQNGVYLITGGLGGVGLVLAEHLARTVKAKLALVQRSTLPPREQWARWNEEHDESEATSRRLRKLQELESLGAEVLILSADVASQQQMRRALEEAQHRFGRINGVIHAAGVPGGGMIQLKTAEKAAAILAPKVQGARVLGHLFKDAGLDFMLLCSSRSALLGGFGQVDYCAGNAFLDAFAHYYSAQSETFTVSVDWDGWQEVGMLVNTAAQYLNSETPPTSSPSTGHPWLESRLPETDGQEVYLTQFSVNKQWILEEHRIGGTAVVPGVTYLEMARAAFEKHANGGAIQINDVYFISPMSIKDDEQREVRFVLQTNGDTFKFQVSSKSSLDKSAQPKWQEHALGQLARAPERSPKKYDIDALIRRCNVREAIVTEEERDPDLGPRWQNIQKVYIGKGEILVLFELDEVFAGDLKQFKLHPSLLDRAAGTGMIYFDNIEGLYLPLSYKQLTMRQPLTRKIYALIRYNEDEGSNKETVTFDVTIMDPDGNELVEIDEFSEKRINDLTERIRARAAESLSSITDEPQEQENQKSIYQESIEAGIPPKDGADAFARILAASVGAQVVVSTRDLQASIERANAFTHALVNEEIEKLQPARSKHPRPTVPTDYVAPRNDDERVLAGILQDMLGIEAVGVYDNFFQLGGDSVLAIQIIARANRAGLHLTPQQIFQHQTVAELAVAARKTKPVEAEQGTVTGVVPLTPIQHWFFEQKGPQPDVWSLAVMLETRKALDATLLESAMGRLLEQHDALRLRFSRDDSGWRQWSAPAEGAEIFNHQNLSGLTEIEQTARIEATQRMLQESLDISHGPLTKFAHFDLGPGRSGRLLAVVHRLAVDNLSWQILLEDLDTVYHQLESKHPLRLPRKTSSFKQWAERLQADATAQASTQEASYWTDKRYEQSCCLPLDYPGGENTAASTVRLVVSLHKEESLALRESVPQAYHVQVTDLLIASLAQAFTKWSGTNAFLAHSEGPGRETHFEGIDLTRSVGWFSQLFPMLLELKPSETPGQSLRTVKEQLRQVPDWGLGYGPLRYLSDDTDIREALGRLPEPEVFISFQPLPHIIASNSTLFQPALHENGGDVVHHFLPTRRYVLEVRVFESDDALQAEWVYSENLHSRATIEGLAQGFLVALRELIARSETSDAGDYTPSDFPLASLNEKSLKTLEMLIDHAEE
jgi:phthiocerol/phenolphthiocerol synthesis type-I polyketide synthase E